MRYGGWQLCPLTDEKYKNNQVLGKEGNCKGSRALKRRRSLKCFKVIGASPKELTIKGGKETLERREESKTKWLKWRLEKRGGDTESRGEHRGLAHLVIKGRKKKGVIRTIS